MTPIENIIVFTVIAAVYIFAGYYYGNKQIGHTVVFAFVVIGVLMLITGDAWAYPAAELDVRLYGHTAPRLGWLKCVPGHHVDRLVTMWGGDLITQTWTDSDGQGVSLQFGNPHDYPARIHARLQCR